MYATIIIFIIIVILVIIYLSCRRYFDRSRVSDNRNSVNNISAGIGESKESVDRIGTGLEKLSINTESAIRRTEDIKQNNDNARTGVDNALEILRKAKNRDNT